MSSPLRPAQDTRHSFMLSTACTLKFMIVHALCAHMRIIVIAEVSTKIDYLEGFTGVVNGL